jgi:hypothetical protein
MPYGNTQRLARKEPVLAEGTGDIVSAVEYALAQRGGLDSRHILVTAKGSDITLRGWVSSRAEVECATEAATGVKGVHAIYNDVRVRPSHTVRAGGHVCISYNRRFFPRFTGMAYHLGNM